jgi:hypothetical protein
MRDAVERLLERVAELSISPVATRRHDELVAAVLEAGHTREYADLMYEIATEVGVDPALAFAVVISGIGVRELADSPADQWEETQVEAPPLWVNAEVLHPDQAARERQIRTTFRRLRRTLDSSPTADAALRAFVREPDVGNVRY